MKLRRFPTTLVLAASTLGGLALPTAITTAAPVVVPAPANTVSILNLREPASGPSVEVVQRKLISFGYVVADKIGVFGRSTTRVLKTFQQQNGLNPTGVVTENTAKYLGYPGGTAPAPGTGGGAAAPAATPAAAGTAGTPAAGYVGLKLGSAGETVRVLQTKLIALGLVLSGGADGVFGRSTETAVKLVQRVNGLPETGVVTDRVAKILGLTGSASSPTTPAPAGPVLQYGSHGDAVKRVQQLLIKVGIAVHGGADGVFGTHTRQAVRTFQQSKGLPVTGTVDATTDTALTKAASPATPAPTTVPGSTPLAPAPSGNAVIGLRMGSTGAGVKLVQRAILKAGMYLRGGADGIFGQSTHNAVAFFQKVNGLPQTGVVNAPTANVMGLASPTTPPATGGGNSAAGFAVFDERGPRVVSLQKALLKAGVAVPGGADGFFGASTLGAIRSFQQARGLAMTGKVDQATANALGLSPANAPAPTPAPTMKLQSAPVGGNCWYSDTWLQDRGGGRVHLGVDIGGAEGTPLKAVAGGRITKVYVDRPGSLSGNGLRITMADGTYFFYGHLQKLAPGIAVGATVTAGQVVGYMGHTGNTGVTHLHLEVHPRGGSAVNPYPYVKAVGCS